MQFSLNLELTLWFYFLFHCILRFLYPFFFRISPSQPPPPPKQTLKSLSCYSFLRMTTLHLDCYKKNLSVIQIIYLLLVKIFKKFEFSMTVDLFTIKGMFFSSKMTLMWTFKFMDFFTIDCTKYIDFINFDIWILRSANSQNQQKQCPTKLSAPQKLVPDE